MTVCVEEFETSENNSKNINMRLLRSHVIPMADEENSVGAEQQLNEGFTAGKRRRLQPSSPAEEKIAGETEDTKEIHEESRRMTRGRRMDFTRFYSDQKLYRVEEPGVLVNRSSRRSEHFDNSSKHSGNVVATRFTLPQRSTRFRGRIIDGDDDEDVFERYLDGSGYDSGPDFGRSRHRNRSEPSLSSYGQQLTHDLGRITRNRSRTSDSYQHRLFANGTAEKSKTNEGNDNDDDDEVPIIRSLRSRSRFVDEIDADKRMEPAASDEVQNAGVDNEDGEDNDDINSPHYHVDDNNGYRLRSRKRLISYSEKNPAVNRFERQNSPEPRSYTLRPRTEPKNYKVRIPLYEASPKKSEARRRQHTRFAINTRYEGGFGNNLRFGLSSMLLGPLGVENDDDSDVDAGELKNDNARLGNLTAELKPLNSSAFTGDDLERILINKQKSLSSKVLADTDPVAVDHAIDFSSIGGLREQVKSLKEMVLLPLLYPEVFTKFGLVPPRGVLFHGPPGTGKTLLARALANACSSENQKVAFFMRKGADVLSKWVGESERQLKALFEQAKSMQPAIIFFDEIDGLAPVRSAKQDQIHSSIVTTMLALMDGLDSRGQVVVIGATNRIDSIDPALRRPGRFDREWFFPLPDREARKEIIRIHTKKFDPPLPEVLYDELADVTRGYCGSDLKALCTEAALRALERRYPQIYDSTKKLAIDVDDIKVEKMDFARCIQSMVPSTHRLKPAFILPLPRSLVPLLGGTLEKIMATLKIEFPIAKLQNTPASEQENNSLTHGTHSLLQCFRPRLLITSELVNNGQSQLASAVLNELEDVHVHMIDISSMYEDSSRSPETFLVHMFSEVRRKKPGIIYISRIDIWWRTVQESTRILLEELLNQLQPHEPILLIATAVAQQNLESVDDYNGFERLFASGREHENIIVLEYVNIDARVAFFGQLLDDSNLSMNGIRRENGRWMLLPDEWANSRLQSGRQAIEDIPLAPSEPPKKLSMKEIRLLHEYDQSVFRRLRIVLREFLHEIIRCKDYKNLTKGLNPIEDYEDFVKYDAHDILDKVERNEYHTFKKFRKDLGELSIGFQRLIEHRQEIYRMTNLNALVDIMEEWLRSVDPQLIKETAESALREKRLSVEYQQLTRQLLQSYNQSVIISENVERDGRHSQRASRRLRGESPAFAAEILDERLLRSAFTNGSNIEDAENVREGINLRSVGSHEELNDSMDTEEIVNNCANEFEIAEQSDNFIDNEPEISLQSDIEKQPVVVHPPPILLVKVKYFTADEFKYCINAIASRTHSKSVDELEAIKTDCMRIIFDWRCAVQRYVEQIMNGEESLETEEIDLIAGLQRIY